MVQGPIFGFHGKIPQKLAAIYFRGDRPVVELIDRLKKLSMANQVRVSHEWY